MFVMSLKINCMANWELLASLGDYSQFLTSNTPFTVPASVASAFVAGDLMSDTTKWAPTIRDLDMPSRETTKMSIWNQI